MMRTRVNLGIAGILFVWLIPGDLEKGTMKNLSQPYPEPAQVPLGEKPKMCESNLVQGIRQISPVSSV